VNAEVGMPINFMVRYVMEHASTLSEAVDYFSDFLDTPGNNYGTSGAILLLVDFNDSSMAKIQVRSEIIEVTYGEELKPGVTYVYGTNHFLGDFNPDPDYYYESSFLRLDRLLEILPAYDTCDLETCWDILSDHGDGDANNNTISRDGNGFAATATVFSTVFTGENVYYTIQRPHEYLDIYGEPIVIDFGPQSSPNCLVEAIYGKHAEETERLRHFRDNVLRKTPEGQELLQLYYQWSPQVVRKMEANKEFMETVKGLIDGVLLLIEEE